jgi:hypothetical protein
MTNGDPGFRIAFGRIGLIGAIFLVAFLALFAITAIFSTDIPQWLTGGAAAGAAVFLAIGR